MKRQIGIVIGTRPEAIKLIPLYLEMQKSSILQPVLISTGQHKEMLYQIFNFFEIKPDIELEVMTQGQTLTSLTSKLILILGETFDKFDFDTVVVQGDTTTAFTAGLVAYYRQIKVAHVEAGLRTYDIYSPFPEEVNRKLIAGFATYNFAPTTKAVKALELERLGGIHMVGNTVIDSLLLCHAKLKEQLAVYENKFVGLQGKNLVLVTGHRRESFGGGFENICNAIKTLALKYADLHFVYPVHLNPNVQKIVYALLDGIDNVALIDPLPYDELIYIMSNATMVLTDSGGIQEEAPTFDIPIVVMRNKTERQEGVEAGCAVLAGTTKEGIVNAFSTIMDDEAHYAKMAAAQNPYGDGTTSQKIVKVLEEA